MTVVLEEEGSRHTAEWQRKLPKGFCGHARGFSSFVQTNALTNSPLCIMNRPTNRFDGLDISWIDIYSRKVLVTVQQIEDSEQHIYVHYPPPPFAEGICWIYKYSSQEDFWNQVIFSVLKTVSQKFDDSFMILTSITYERYIHIIKYAQHSELEFFAKENATKCWI